MEDDIAELEGAKTETFTLADILRFLIPSLIGVGIFLMPVSSGGKNTIMIGLITDQVRSIFNGYAMEILIVIVTLSAVGGCYHLLMKPDWSHRAPIVSRMFSVTPIWAALRAAAAIIGWMVYLHVGPEVIRGAQTGQMVFTDIGTNIIFIVTIACFLMPFLTDFGFMEFIGSLVRKPFEILFRLPGRAAIDAAASFVSASTVGLLITIGQYEKGQYTAREACCVATNFSVVSISFSLVVASVAGIDHMFFTWYLTVIIACLLCALITVRVPPLSQVSNEYYPPIGQQIHEIIPNGISNFRWGLHEAIKRAKLSPNPKQLFISGANGAVDVLFGILGPGLAIATLSSIIVFHTSIYQVISFPLIAILDLLNVPEAKEAAPGFVAGVLDQFMPSLIASSIKSELTRFILAGLSVSQLIYFAEVGVLIMRSSLPLNLWQLLMIFILRTLIVFPVFLISGLYLL